MFGQTINQLESRDDRNIFAPRIWSRLCADIEENISHEVTFEIDDGWYIESMDVWELRVYLNRIHAMMESNKDLSVHVRNENIRMRVVANIGKVDSDKTATLSERFDVTIELDGDLYISGLKVIKGWPRL